MTERQAWAVFWAVTAVLINNVAWALVVTDIANNCPVN